MKRAFRMKVNLHREKRDTRETSREMYGMARFQNQSCFSLLFIFITEFYYYYHYFFYDICSELFIIYFSFVKKNEFNAWIVLGKFQIRFEF